MALEQFLTVLGIMLMGILYHAGFPFLGCLDAVISLILHVFTVCRVLSAPIASMQLTCNTVELAQVR